RAARGAERAARARAALSVGLAAGVVLVPIGSRGARSGEWVAESDRAIRWLERGAYAEAAAGFARAESELGDARVQALSTIAWVGLIRLRVQAGRLDAAAQALDDARSAGLDPVTADIFECFLSVRRGDPARARRLLARIPSDPPPPDPLLRDLLAESRRALAENAGR